MKQHEYLEQCEVFRWAKMQEWKFPHLKFLHASLNGVRLTMGQSKKMSLSGMRRGVADICLPFKNEHHTQLFIEMKHGKNKLTEDQAKFERFVCAGGADYVVAYSALEAIAAIKKYLITCPPLLYNPEISRIPLDKSGKVSGM